MTKGSLRRYLTLWFSGLSLLTLFSVVFYAGHIATEQMKQANGATLSNIARAAAALLGDQLHQRQLDILLLSEAPHLVRGDLDDPDILQSMERRFRACPEYAWMGVADTDGRVRQAVKGLLVNQSVKDHPWFQAGLRGFYTSASHEDVLLAKQLPGNANGELLRFIDFAAPIHNASGRVVGVLSAHVNWNWVTTTVESAVLRKDIQRGIEVLIIDRNGELLYPQRLITQQLPKMPLPQESHYGAQEWPDGNGYLTSIIEVDTPAATSLGLYIVVRQPLDHTLEPVRALLYKLLGLGVIAALVFGLVAYRLALHISRPIEQLVVSAKLVQSQQLDVTFPLHHPILEIAQLGQSIRGMTQSLLEKERELQETNAYLEATVAQRTAELTQANADLLKLATHDALTGLYNRRRFDEKLAESRLLFQRTGRTFALLIIDADHFKLINDTHGHAIGDSVLRQLAMLIQNSTRATDFVARYGGEEFAVLLQEVEGTHCAESVAEKIRAAVGDATFTSVGQVTVSIGIGLAESSDTNTTALVERADLGLYEAKCLGRNRAVLQSMA